MCLQIFIPWFDYYLGCKKNPVWNLWYDPTQHCFPWKKINLDIKFMENLQKALFELWRKYLKVSLFTNNKCVFSWLCRFCLTNTHFDWLLSHARAFWWRFYLKYLIRILTVCCTRINKILLQGYIFCKMWWKNQFWEKNSR